MERIELARHEPAAYLWISLCAPVSEQFLVIFIKADVTFFVLACIFCSELQFVSIESAYKRQLEIEVCLIFILHNILILIGQFVYAPAVIIQIWQRNSTVGLASEHILEARTEVDSLILE